MSCNVSIYLSVSRDTKRTRGVDPLLSISSSSVVRSSPCESFISTSVPCFESILELMARQSSEGVVCTRCMISAEIVWMEAPFLNLYIVHENKSVTFGVYLTRATYLKAPFPFFATSNWVRLPKTSSIIQAR